MSEANDARRLLCMRRGRLWRSAHHSFQAWASVRHGANMREHSVRKCRKVAGTSRLLLLLGTWRASSARGGVRLAVRASHLHRLAALRQDVAVGALRAQLLQHLTQWRALVIHCLASRAECVSLGMHRRLRCLFCALLSHLRLQRGQRRTRDRIGGMLARQHRRRCLVSAMYCWRTGVKARDATQAHVRKCRSARCTRLLVRAAGEWRQWGRTRARLRRLGARLQGKTHRQGLVEGLAALRFATCETRLASLSQRLSEERELLSWCRSDNVKLQQQLLQAHAPLPPPPLLSAPPACSSRGLQVVWHLWCESVHRGAVLRKSRLTATRRCVHLFRRMCRAAWTAWAACVLHSRVLRRWLLRLVCCPSLRQNAPRISLHLRACIHTAYIHCAVLV